MPKFRLPPGLPLLALLPWLYTPSAGRVAPPAPPALPASSAHSCTVWHAHSMEPWASNVVLCSVPHCFAAVALCQQGSHRQLPPQLHLAAAGVKLQPLAVCRHCRPCMAQAQVCCAQPRPAPGPAGRAWEGWGEGGGWQRGFPGWLFDTSATGFEGSCLRGGQDAWHMEVSTASLMV